MNIPLFQTIWRLLPILIISCNTNYLFQAVSAQEAVSSVEKIEPYLSVKTKILRNGEEQEVFLVLKSPAEYVFPTIKKRKWLTTLKFFHSDYNYDQLPDSYKIGHVLEKDKLEVIEALDKYINEIFFVRLSFDRVAEAELMLQIYFLLNHRVTRLLEADKANGSQKLNIMVNKISKLLNIDLSRSNNRSDGSVNMTAVRLSVYDQFILKYSTSTRLSALCTVDTYIFNRNKEPAMSSHWNNLERGNYKKAKYSISTAIEDSMNYLDLAKFYDQYGEYAAFINDEQNAVNIYDEYHTFYILFKYARSDWGFAKDALSEYMQRNLTATLTITKLDGSILEIYDAFTIKLVS
jgi:hypothetical protein